ncbi:hypothetical protein Kisp01_50090 [Kineosporia sp. NBRC 101677]|uniref:SCO6880 family protein n=1 Tax=Kineosporia sp. NBRC 101677 TaxID=3032197 RepID=UPI0024A25208|nr:SCO6880 family protein [Kineosporia sp. NBRC 101677]GLY17995.1 hypothetical protein Kisp01_50090 [Kineosporia sp. NBRC 101677]
MTATRLYGNWLRPKTLNVRGLGWRGLLAVVGSYFFGLALLQSAPKAGLSLLLACLAVTSVAAIRVNGLGLGETLVGKGRWWWAQTSSSTRFLAVRSGSWALPGALHGTQMVPVEIAGRSYGAVHDARARRIAVTFELASTAADLTDQQDHDLSVGRWERWLEGLGRRPEIAWVNVTVETSPSMGGQLRENIHGRLSLFGPTDCTDLMRRLAEVSPTVAAKTTTRLTVVFDLRAWDAQVGGAGRRKGITSYLPVLDRSITSLAASLNGCGVSVLRIASADVLGGLVRAAFDPSAELQIELALATGERELPRWEMAGPSYAYEMRDHYVHDGATSVSFVWAQAPQQLVTSRVLDALMRPGQCRKRVTVTYVATPTHEAMDVATAQVRWRWFAQMIARLPIVGRATTAADDREAQAAEQATREVAAGAGWVSATVTATVTVLDPDALPSAVAELEHAAGASQLRLRRLYELQAAGFLVGLPVGLSLTELARRWSR